MVSGQNLVLNVFNILYLLNDKLGHLDRDISKEKEFIQDIDSPSEFYYMYCMHTHFTSILDNKVAFLEILFNTCDEILDIVFCSRILSSFIEEYSFDNKHCLKFPNCPISKLLEEKKVCYIMHILLICFAALIFHFLLVKLFSFFFTLVCGQ